MNALTSCFPANALPAMLADAGPFSLICVGETLVHDPDLGSWPVQTTFLLGRFRELDEAIGCAARRGRPGGLRVEYMLGFTPNLLVLQDHQQRLCLAGQIASAGLIWCAPVASEAEARRVVQKACRLRGQAMAAQDRGEYETACDLRRDATALDARLVDPAWRGAVQIGRLQAA